jgi:hypothetical protein
MPEEVSFPASLPDVPPVTPEASGKSADEKTKPQSAPIPGRTLDLTAAFVIALATGQDAVEFPLPDGKTARGSVEQRHVLEDGSPVGVTGSLDAPSKGTFQFRVQAEGAPTGPVVGAVVIDDEETAFGVRPGLGGTSLLTELPVDEVICRGYAAPQPEAADESEAIPAEHPVDIPIPDYQNGVIPLQGRPGAVAVIYLDFDGQKGPHEGWGTFDAAPSNATNTQIKEVWTRVCEDFAPFDVNVTTDLGAFLAAPQNRRQRCIITPTTTASPGNGGVAKYGTFSWSGDTPCWSFHATGKNAAEVISHEIGHTLGLSHDGRTSPVEEYYRGHGSGTVGWASIMGVGYYENLTQWSKGEYAAANQKQDDLATIAGKITYRTDDADSSHATAALLDTFTGGMVDTEGVIETRSDVDAFRFITTGGPVNLVVSPVTPGSNLDVQASIFDSNGSLIISNNPDAALDATLETVLPAGEFSVRIDGVGRGDVLSDGYSDYGSLGQYTITGTIDGVFVPDRFAVSENAPAGTAVGTPLPREYNAGAALIYSISAGNTDSAFAINAATGTIVVATSAALDYEALSASWATPPIFNLTVNVQDPGNPALDESLRVVVVVNNVNEVPTIAGNSSLTVISHTVAGTVVGSLTGTDPDAFDFPIISIASGNEAGKFNISKTGAIFVAGDLDSTVHSIYELTVRASDHAQPPLWTDLTVTVTILPAPPTLTPGFVNHTIYSGISGAIVAALTGSAIYPTAPTSEVRLSSFTQTTQDSTYGSTIRAWLIAPVTGSYQFWIAADDSADLYFNSAGNPAAATRICYLSTLSSYQQWTKNATQASATFSLMAGQVCYIEARHKQQFDSGHLSVAWEIKNPSASATLVPRQVIPGNYLAPHHLNYAPKVINGGVSLYRNTYVGSLVALGPVSDMNAEDHLTLAITGGNEAGIFGIDPATNRVVVANTAALAASVATTLFIDLTVTDDTSPPLSGSGRLTVNLLGTSDMPHEGYLAEYWDGVPGTSLQSLYTDPRYPGKPDRLAWIGRMLSTRVGQFDNYGARIRAYLIPPSTGYYSFRYSGTTDATVYFSSDANPANAVEVLNLVKNEELLSWSTNTTRVHLVAGQRYFFEARLKDAMRSDDYFNLTWLRPDGTDYEHVGGTTHSYGRPYDSNVPPEFGEPSYAFPVTGSASVGAFVGRVGATDSDFEEIRYAIVSGDSAHDFSIDPSTGIISVANSTNLQPGTTYQLQVGAQDSGHGRIFVPRETLVPVTVVVPGFDAAPVFNAAPVALGDFPAGQQFSVSLVSQVTDPADILTFSLVDGPPWLSITPAGVLLGTPAYADFGKHTLTVAVRDLAGHVVDGVVLLSVSVPHDAPGSTIAAINAVNSTQLGSAIPGTTPSNASTSDNSYLVLNETNGIFFARLASRWTFPTLPGRLATLKLEAFHSANTEGDDFQFGISTDGGVTFQHPASLLVTKTADDDTAQSFTFVTGSTGSTIVEVRDTDLGYGGIADTLSIDLLAIDYVANSAPSVVAASLQVASHAQAGVRIGPVNASDADGGQALAFSITRGNDAGLFAITTDGTLTVAGDIPFGAGPFELIVVAIDNGLPALGNYALVTVNVVEPIPATIALGNLTPTYDSSGHPAVATTDPPGLAVELTYDGSAVLPVAAGSYSVQAVILDALHTGSASATMTVGKAPAEIILSGLGATYDGIPKPVTVTTVPPSLAVDVSYGGSLLPPTAAGTYAVTATIVDSNYAGTSTASLVIGPGSLLIGHGQTHILSSGDANYQSLLNEGTLISRAGATHVIENLTNSGTLILSGDAVIDVEGVFSNTGVIDVINWKGTLPEQLFNSGTILNRTSPRVLSSQLSDNIFTLTVPGYSGHRYQLETSDSPVGSWLPAGESLEGSGSLLDPPVLEFSGPAGETQRFFRVSVTPAP